MKNKLLTYGLILTVAAVWGYVIYRIIKATQSDDNLPQVVRRTDAQVDDLSYYTIKDFDSLALDYRDPIYHKDDNKSNFQSTEPIENNIVQQDPPMDYGYVPQPEPETAVAYLGFIENQKTKKKTAILQIENQQYMLVPKESTQGVTLLHIGEESIQIKSKGKTKTIYK